MSQRLAVRTNQPEGTLACSRKGIQEYEQQQVGINSFSDSVYTHIGTSAHLISSLSMANEETDLR